MKLKKFVSMLLCVVLLGSLLVACGSSESSDSGESDGDSGASDGKTKITVLRPGDE